jgi:hypothetical protein
MMMHQNGGAARMVNKDAWHGHGPRRIFPGRALLFFVVTLFFAGLAAPVQAQERYDGEEPRERFQIRVGGFYQNDIDTTIRVDNKDINLGTIIELEDKLDVDSEVSVFRLDGFYRFNPRHRLDWSWYQADRDGRKTINEEIEIGDEVFPIGATMDTEFKSGLIKIGYSWSFINVRKYEFYVGAGLNFHDASFKFQSESGATTQVEDEDVLIPLPTLNFGGRYNFTEKTQLSLRWELFDIQIGDYEGRFQETTLLLDHNTFKHIGFGGGLTSFVTSIELENEDWGGEFESSYSGLLLYLKFYF